MINMKLDGLMKYSLVYVEVCRGVILDIGEIAVIIYLNGFVSIKIIRIIFPQLQCSQHL